MRAGELDLLDLELPLVLRPSGEFSDDDLIRFSERNKPYRVERNREGEIVVMTPVGGIGGTHEVYVASTLYEWTQRTGGGVSVGPNTGFNLPDGSCLAPDASWLSMDRWNALTSEQKWGFPPLCPEFIIEVRSRSDSRRLLEAKMQLWIDNGARLAWLVDPIDNNVTVYQIDASPHTLDRPKVVVGTAPVAGFKLSCEQLWSSR